MTAAQIEAVVAAPELPEVSVLRVQPGDTIVFRFKERISDEAWEMWRTDVKGRFPDNEVMCLEGCDLLIVRKDGE